MIFGDCRSDTIYGLSFGDSEERQLLTFSATDTAVRCRRGDEGQHVTGRALRENRAAREIERQGCRAILILAVEGSEAVAVVNSTPWRPVHTS